MNIFDKRPLALILCIFVGGFVVFSFSDAVWHRASYLTVISVLAMLAILLFFKKCRRQCLKGIAVTVTLIISFLFSNVYFGCYFKAEKLYEDEISANAIITEFQKDGYSTRILLDVSEINGSAVSYRFVAWIDGDTSISLSRGDGVEIRGSLDGFGESRDYFYSDGVSAILKIDEIAAVSRNNSTLEMKLADIRELLCRRATMQSDGGTGSFISALLLGDRDRLSGEISSSFRSLGISHILALSGMHLAILTAGVERLLRMLGAGRRSRAVASAVFTLLYMGLTGFSPSVVRAGIMLITASLLFLLSRGHDATTSLSVAVFVIVVISPYSIYDISLWLSAFATLGIIIVSERPKNPQGKRSRGLVIRFSAWCRDSLLASLFAMASVLPFNISLLSSISLVAPLATIFFSVLSEAIMYIGTLMLIIGDLLPIGMLLKPIVDLTVWLATACGQLPGLLVSTSSLVTKVLAILFAILFYAFILLNVKNRRIGVAAVLCGYLIFTITAMVSTGLNMYTTDIFYVSDERADAIVLKSDGKGYVIDSSAYSDETAYSWREVMSGEGILYIDKYVITHYSRQLPDMAVTLMSMINVREFILPTPCNEDEYSLLSEFTQAIAPYGTNVSTEDTSVAVALGDFEYVLEYTVPYGDGSSEVVFTLDDAENYYLYLSSGVLVGETKAVATELIGQSDVLILGNHGSKYSDTYYFDSKYSQIRMIILGSDELYFTQDCLKYYEDRYVPVHSHPKMISILTGE